MWCRPRVRRASGKHFVQHATERIDVCPSIHFFLAKRLLRRHVGRCAERETGLRKRRSGRFHRSRNAKIRDKRMPVGEQNVLWLDVAMNDTVLVRIRQRVGHLTGVVEGGGDRERTIAPHSRPQGLAIHERHEVVEEPVDLAGIDQRHDVGVVQLRRDLDLAQETVGAERSRKVGVDHFHGDLPVVTRVVRQVHGAHPARAKLTLDLVPPLKGGSQQLDSRTGHA